MCSRAPTHMIQHFSTKINYYICQMHHHPYLLPLSCLFWLINCIWPFKISIVFSNTTCLINWSTDRSKLNSGSQSDELLLRIGKCRCCPHGPRIACDPQDGPFYGRIVTTTQMVQHMGKKAEGRRDVALH